ncbi:MAG: Flp pilus assembly protein TadD [Verrucomicrobiales bacterium]|jgi:Flp pilus assembly protein TadD
MPSTPAAPPALLPKRRWIAWSFSCLLITLNTVFGPAAGQEGSEKSDSAFTTGFAEKDAGSLPAYTSELAKKAANAISKRDWGTAKAAYEEMLESAPDNALTLSNLGAVEFQIGDTANARTHLERAVQQQPRLAATWTTLALIYYQEKDLHLALSAISRAVHERPNNARARNYLGVIIKSLGWSNGAEAELQRAIKIDPNYAEAHFNLALMFLERKPPAIELASRHYAKARALGAAPDKLVEKQLVEVTE